ncbi:MAG: hypothetical protein LIO53_09095 [Oscillospiraceae bacterium]|nr:hypothetical protein [Oscillospiraceae bacterium]
MQPEKSSSLVCCESEYLYVYGNYLSERSLILNGNKYVIFWTPHAQKRAIYRSKSGTVILSAYLKNMLESIAKNTNILKSYTGYITLRDFKTDLFAVIHISDDENCRRIRVITCSDALDTYPHENDRVIQRNKNGNIRCYIWRIKSKTKE